MAKGEFLQLVDECVELVSEVSEDAYLGKALNFIISDIKSIAKCKVDKVPLKLIKKAAKKRENVLALHDASVNMIECYEKQKNIFNGLTKNCDQAIGTASKSESESKAKAIELIKKIQDWAKRKLRTRTRKINIYERDRDKLESILDKMTRDEVFEEQFDYFDIQKRVEKEIEEIQKEGFGQ